MIKVYLTLILICMNLLPKAYAQQNSPRPLDTFKDNRVKIKNGMLEGTLEPGSAIRSFKGIPFAEPPVGDLRWKEPQPVKNWSGVRKANKFGPRAMQLPVFGDMNFRSDGMSEDCLYLNVWTPAKSSNERLPVLVYIYGGGFIAGDGSEPRYDGESMAKKGIVTLTINHRLNVFGFMAHPELSKESPKQASGNYGLLDQYAALRWVQENIAAFGGDPKRVTIAGESAGSISVSAQMASPLSKGMIAGAIGESGSILGALPASSLEEGEQNGIKFANMVNAESLAELRSIPADKLLQATGKQGAPRFNPTVDGYFFPKQPIEIFRAGEQAQVPLLLGWNSEEASFRWMLGNQEPTPKNYEAAVRKQYAEQADEVLKLYPGETKEQVMKSGNDLAGDRFIAYSTWKWYDLHSKTGNKPTYRYYYSKPRPSMTPEMGNAVAGLAGGVTKGTGAAKPAPPATGAVHSAEIEYALGNLATNQVYAWTKEDYKVSNIMQNYFANFIKTGNPNGKGLPAWSASKSGSTKPEPVMHIDVNTQQKADQHRARYLFMDKNLMK